MDEATEIRNRMWSFPPGGGGIPYNGLYSGRLRPNGVPCSGFRYIKGWDFTSWGIQKIKEIGHLEDAPYEWISLFIKHNMKMRTRLPKVDMRKGYLSSIKGI